MERKKSLMLAGFLTAALTTGVVSFGSFVAGAANPPVAAAAQQVDAAPQAATALADDVEVALAEREAVLAGQLEQSKQALANLDQQAQAQIAELQRQVDAADASAQARAGGIERLQQDAAALQQAIEQDGLVFQQELAAHQAADAQLADQLNVATAQLQAAYGEIAARQEAQMASAASSNRPAGDDEGEQEEHEHEEHGDDE
jgi:septal ring factor EnvC (AmiA/AmiB activator)